MESKPNGNSSSESPPAAVIWKHSMKDGSVPFHRFTDNTAEADAKKIKKDKHFEENLKDDSWTGQFVRKIDAAGGKGKQKVFEDGTYVYSK